MPDWLVTTLPYISLAISALTALVVVYSRLDEYLYQRRLDRLKKSSPCKGEDSLNSTKRTGWPQ